MGGALAGPEEPEIAQGWQSEPEIAQVSISGLAKCDAEGWADCDEEVYYRKDTSVLSNARAATLVPVDQLLRALSATLRLVSVTAGQGPQDPSALSVLLATGDSRRKVAGAANVHEATVTHTQAAAPVLQGSVGSAVTPAASSTRCLYRAGLGAMAYTVRCVTTVWSCFWMTSSGLVPSFPPSVSSCGVSMPAPRPGPGCTG